MLVQTGTYQSYTTSTENDVRHNEILPSRSQPVQTESTS
jgi:hypothetical protein